MSAGGSLLLSDVSNEFPSQRNTSTHMVSVVKITTFFIKVFSDPPRLDLERSKRMTAVRVVETEAMSQTACTSLLVHRIERVCSLVAQIKISRIGHVIAHAFANFPIFMPMLGVSERSSRLPR